jgi:hypothetical protein
VSESRFRIAPEIGVALGARFEADGGTIASAVSALPDRLGESGLVINGAQEASGPSSPAT